MTPKMIGSRTLTMALMPTAEVAPLTAASSTITARDLQLTATTGRIDLDGIGQRILSIDIPARNYTSLQPGTAPLPLRCLYSSSAASAEGANYE